ncbi:hypothetical protein DOS79_01165 [Staphylococcus felis]|uniref:Phage portal protein n=1 Tax=Staphylococcus felis TaxID=46127 RepID=A0A3E0IKT3_9STAP|nr:hypothetical protein DOS61_09670 [Staphylococcus felis]REH89007.1 hypothetical protein DOS83_13775 [Staphylococcus felis]REH92873.1 hypothetical protein DOS58_00455 [Staphylococcus felis]REI15172.1 hypothetical protein DOS75_09930 [Staphylococcus felis]REI30904.1 hypothetical protein DOS79_01165 [Staphylococcus felis]
MLICNYNKCNKEDKEVALYRNSNLIWKQFSRNTIKDVHGDMYYYRSLYEGKHHELFPRAKELIEKGEIIDVYSNADNYTSKNVRTPYLMLNICRVIVDVPSLLVSRSIGQFKTNYSRTSDTLQKQQDSEITDDFSDTDLIEGTKTNDINGIVVDPQQELIDQVIKNSKLNHNMNVSQLLIDGGIVAVPSMRNNQLSIEFKERNVYYPHDDGLGVDLVYELEQTEEEEMNNINYIHVYTERENGQSLEMRDRLYVSDGNGELTLVEDPQIIEEKLHVTSQELDKVFHGRQRTLICYLANEPTFTNRFGRSSLVGLDGKQEEVNWSLTRTAQTFERNGKPRISVTKGTMQRLQEIALNQYGDENKIDHRNLEVTEIDDETGESIVIHQIDTSKIGDMNYVKDIIRAMLAETQTSENAVEFVKRDTAHSQSGVAKFYDLMISIIKAEKIRDEYVEFLKDVIESALWIANHHDNNVIIERPNAILKNMIPQPKAELSQDSISKFNAGIQSLEEAVRESNPTKSEEWIKEEIERIQSDTNRNDTMSLDRGRQTLQNFMNNRNSFGQPLDEFGNPINTNNQEDDSQQEE